MNWYNRVLSSLAHMSRPRKIGEIRLQLDGEQRKVQLNLHNIGARKTPTEQPIELHFIDLHGRVRDSLHDIFPYTKDRALPNARIVVFRHFSLSTVEDDEMTIVVRRGIIEAAIFAQYLFSKPSPSDHRELLSFFFATLIRRAFCQEDTDKISMRRKHSKSVREKVTQLLHGIVVNNGAFLEWSAPTIIKDPNIALLGPQSSRSSDLDDDEDQIGMLDPDDIQRMKRFSRKFQYPLETPKSELQQHELSVVWNPMNVGSLKDFSDEGVCDIYQSRIEEAIQEQLDNEAA